MRPPVAPMLGRLTRELPLDGYVYEPKWDGFRCLAFCAGADIDLRSRHDRPLSRYFPELVEALAGREAVLDGEILACADGRFDFTALLGRLHPAASRVERLRIETPARFVAFDLLAAGGEDLRGRPFAQRRHALEELLADAPEQVQVTPATHDVAQARAWLAAGAGIDGVIAKRTDAPYQPGARTMLKVKPERTADCVVAGLRLLTQESEPLLSSLLLGLYDARGELRHVGVASSFSRAARRDLLAELAPHVVGLKGHPWEHGFLISGNAIGRLKGAAARWDPATMALDWVPLDATRVCEVAYDHVDADRFRHPARLRRWRPDREPRSCLLDQLC